MIYPMFSASPSLRDWNAMPTHSPSSLKAGPPLLPALMAASICTPRSSLDPWAYAVTCTGNERRRQQMIAAILDGLRRSLGGD